MRSKKVKGLPIAALALSTSYHSWGVSVTSVSEHERSVSATPRASRRQRQQSTTLTPSQQQQQQQQEQQQDRYLEGEGYDKYRANDNGITTKVTERDADESASRGFDAIMAVDRGENLDRTRYVDPAPNDGGHGGAGNLRIAQKERHVPLSSLTIANFIGDEEKDEEEDGGDEFDDNDFDLEANTQIALLRHEDPPPLRDVEGDSIFPNQQTLQQQESSGDIADDRDNVFVNDFGDPERGASAGTEKALERNVGHRAKNGHPST